MLLLFGTAQSQANSDAYVNEAVDVNPDPRIFETTIVAAPMQMTLNSGEEVTVFAYNGQVPGPEISVNQGDRVIVHFENNLPEEYPSTIHWHGIELNNASDGTPMTQAPVPAGGSYTYDFIVPRGGIFWYHPHVRGSQVVNAGLYGSLIVKQDVEKELVNENILPKRDRTLVFSTMAVEDGELKDIEGEPVLATMNGNEGNHLLVNGLENPTINAKVGEPLRLRLINTSITRYFRVSIPGHTIYRVGGEGGLLSNVRVEGGSIMGMRMAMPMDMMDDDMDMGDGSMDMGDGGMDMGDGGMDMGDGGMDMPVYTGYEGPIMIDQGYDKGEILLTPAQRADIVIIPQGEVGDTITVQWKDFARGRHQMVMTPMGMMMTEADDDGLRPSIDLFNIKLKKSQNNTTAYSINEGDALVANAGRLDIDRMDSEIKLQANMMAMMSGMPKSTWFMIDDFNGVEGRTNYRTATVGETLKHEVHNHTDMHHPFHLHGFSFQPTMFMTMNHDEGYMDMWTVNPENEYIDTVNIPPHTSAFYLFDVPERPDYGAEAGTTLGDGSVGDWVFHCHILQHGENGMMSFLRVTR
jgi:FtsP/CotA-like multicopper oxidase with cupredoxin domain